MVDIQMLAVGGGQIRQLWGDVIRYLCGVSLSSAISSNWRPIKVELLVMITCRDRVSLLLQLGCWSRAPKPSPSPDIRIDDRLVADKCPLIDALTPT